MEAILDTAELTIETIPETWVIDSEEKANWYLRRLGNLNAEKQRITYQHNAMLINLDRQIASLTGRHALDLEHYAARMLDGTKDQTLRLSQGSCIFRVVPQSIRLGDRVAATAWAQAHAADLVTVRTEDVLETNALRKLAQQRLDADGELIPGMEVTPAHLSFRVAFGGGE